MADEEDRTTVTIERERLRVLLDQTARANSGPHVRTVPRRVLARGSKPMLPVAEPAEDAQAPRDEPAPQIPPLLIWAMILIFVVLFVGVIRIS